MKVGVIGGTGYIGSYLIDALLDYGLQPVVLVRPGSQARLRHADHCQVIDGDLGDVDAILRLVKQVDAVIYNVGILREFPARGVRFSELHENAARHVIDASVQAGVSNFLLMSANGVNPHGTPYQRHKHAADEYLAGSGLNYSIFRPSVVFGDPRGRMEFATQLCRDIVCSPLPAPLFFDGLNPMKAGCFELSPVHVEDVARAFVNQLVSPAETNRIFHLGGSAILSWKEILTTIAAAIGRRKLMLPVPVQGVKIVAGLLDQFEQFPVTRDQLNMLMEGNICSVEDLKGMGITPRRFEVGELAYLANAYGGHTASAGTQSNAGKCGV
jgi:NADH dehydrogenase